MWHTHTHTCARAVSVTAHSESLQGMRLCVDCPAPSPCAHTNAGCCAVHVRANAHRAAVSGHAPRQTTPLTPTHATHTAQVVEVAGVVQHSGVRPLVHKARCTGWPGAGASGVATGAFHGDRSQTVVIIRVAVCVQHLRLVGERTWRDGANRIRVDPNSCRWHWCWWHHVGGTLDHSASCLVACRVACDCSAECRHSNVAAQRAQFQRSAFKASQPNAPRPGPAVCTNSAAANVAA